MRSHSTPATSDSDRGFFGEVELHAFTFGETRTLFSFFVALGGTLKAPTSRRETFARVLAAFWRGGRAEQLCCRDWEHRFERPLAEVRAELGLVASRALVVGECAAGSLPRRAAAPPLRSCCARRRVGRRMVLFAS